MADADGDEDAPVNQSAPNNDGELDDETQDFRLLSSLNFLDSDTLSLPRRGEKDFEPNPTQHQRSVLDASRQAMHDALSYPRLHQAKNHVVGHYQPEGHNGAFVAVDNAKGPHYRGMGAADRENRTWLLPEEALFLLERGTLDIRWSAADLWSAASLGDPTIKEDIPMSLEAAYATLMGKGGLTLERYHVYAGLKRIGYNIKRAPTWHDSALVPSAEQMPSTTVSTENRTGLWGVFRRVLSTLFTPRPSGNSAIGPLVAPGLYHSYPTIYRGLALIQTYTRDDTISTSPKVPEPPFRIAYHVWKPATAFKKSAPPPPDFRIAVVDARESEVPRLDEVSILLNSLQEDLPLSDKKLEVKLRWGRRNVILAIVDSGVVSYLRLSDAGFGQQKLYEQRIKRGGKGGPRGKGKPPANKGG